MNEATATKIHEAWVRFSSNLNHKGFVSELNRTHDLHNTSSAFWGLDKVLREWNNTIKVRRPSMVMGLMRGDLSNLPFIQRSSNCKVCGITSHIIIIVLPIHNSVAIAIIPSILVETNEWRDGEKNVLNKFMHIFSSFCCFWGEVVESEIWIERDSMKLSQHDDDVDNDNWAQRSTTIRINIDCN